MSSKKNAPAKAVEATEVAQVAAPEMEAVTPMVPTEAEVAEVTKADIVFEAPEKAKRNRSYSQSAINTEDLERLNQLKTFVKENLNVNVSNQRIISAALDCLGNNVEAFLKSIADDANQKQLDKERKAYLELKAKFEAMEVPAEAPTEAPVAPEAK